MAWEGRGESIRYPHFKASQHPKDCMGNGHINVLIQADMVYEWHLREQAHKEQQRSASITRFNPILFESSVHHRKQSITAV